MISIYDTAQATLIKPTFPQEVSVYVCGITPYDSAHLGHAFTFIVYDVLQRYLEYRGHSVRLVRNITDVDDPLFKKAAELNIDYLALAEKETAKFQEVMHALNIRTPHAEPRASKYISEMADAVAKLIETGFAYTLQNGDVYFDVAKDPSFGDNSHFSDTLQLAFMSARGGNPERTEKRNPLDFLLWKAVHDEQDTARWDSPMGHGRPGWHIECSVMSQEILGSPLDIHGGGMDLIYPHHEAENAQSTALGAKPFVKQWMHVAPLSYNGEKMSKSLGNLVFAADLIDRYDPTVVRLALLRYHYRIGGEWLNETLTTASDQMNAIQRAVTMGQPADAERYLHKFITALEDDLDTPEAIRIMMDYVHETIRTNIDERKSNAVLHDMTRLLGISR